MFLKQPRLGGEDLAEDDDDNDDSIGGLGRRIRKLSSRTIEFCDSIDNIQVSDNKNRFQEIVVLGCKKVCKR